MNNLLKEKLDRRKFLKVAGGGITAFALESLLTKVHAEYILRTTKHESRTTKRYAMVIDLRRCIGCGACAIACKQENNVPLGYYRTWVKIARRGKNDSVRDHYLPILCNHCEDAICNRNCPVHATYKTKDGLTLIDYDRCIGCKYCVVSCPYNVRFAHPFRRTVDKCTFCAHRLKKGLEPACVVTCMAKARIFGDINDRNSEISKILSKNSVQVLKPEQNTKPHVFYIGLDEFTIEAGKTDFEYMRYYRREVLKELRLSRKQSENYYNILKGMSNEDREYDYHLRSNI
jgi:tetrathionate reductase subunit B